MYTWQPVAADDFEALHQLRLAAMQPSLEALGIYDSERSRQRFAGRFTPEAARWILCAGERVGFAAMRLGDRCCLLEHLYVAPQYQGRGVGGWALRHLQSEAAAFGMPISLNALRDSPSNQFYQNCGFVPTHEEQWDIYYLWQAADSATTSV